MLSLSRVGHSKWERVSVSFNVKVLQNTQSKMVTIGKEGTCQTNTTLMIKVYFIKIFTDTL